MPVHGRVATLQAIRPPGADCELVLLCTEKRQFALLRWDPAAGLLATVDGGSLHDARGRPLDHPPLCACDPDGRSAVVYMYEGLYKVLSFAARPPQGPAACGPAIGPTPRPVAAEAGLESPRALGGLGAGRLAAAVFTAGAAESRVLDLAFLHPEPSAAPVLVVLHSDHRGRCYLSSWAVDACARDLREGPFGQWCMQTPAAASRLAAAPRGLGGGVLVLGEAAVSLHDRAGLCAGSAAVDLGEVGAVAALPVAEGGRGSWLAGGVDGGLWLVRAAWGEGAAAARAAAAKADITVERLGETSAPRGLAALPGGRVLVGSASGDSQVLHLASCEGSCRLVVQDAWSNLGPVVDFCVAGGAGGAAGTGGAGHGQVVATCSGVGASGSVQLVRAGVCFSEMASADGFGAVTGMWSLPRAAGLGGAVLVLALAGCTRTLALVSADDGAQELAEVATLPGFAEDREALFCCRLGGRGWQVTGTGVLGTVLEGEPAPAAGWAPPRGERLQCAAVAAEGVLVASGGDSVVLLRAAAAGGLAEAARWRLGAEVSCLHAAGGLCAVGLWSRELAVILPGAAGAQPAEGCRHALPALPRSAALAQLGGSRRLLVGLGSGDVAVFGVDGATGALSQCGVVALGSHPPRLLRFQPPPPPRGAASAGRAEEDCVFAACDRAAVAYSRGGAAAAGQLAFARVNLRHVGHVTHFPADDADDALALISEGRLVIGRFDDLQCVHVRAVALGESPQRISFQRQAGLFAVACQTMPGDEGGRRRRPPVGAALSPAGADVDPATIRLVDPRTLEVVQALRLDALEQVGAMCAATLGDDALEHLAVGTALVRADEPEPSTGRVRLYAGRAGSLTLAGLLEVPGAVYALLPFQGMLLGSVNNRVVLWRRVSAPASATGPALELREVCAHTGSIMALHLQAMGDRILVGDLMQSAKLLRYDPVAASLVEVAQDASTSWLTAVEMLSEDVFLCADDHHNVFTLACGPAAAAAPARPGGGAGPEGEPLALQRVGLLHSGEFVNRLRRAALVEPPPAAAAGAPDKPGAEADPARGRPLQQAVWASVDGAVGLVVSLRSEQEFARLSLVQDAVLCEAPRPLGALPHGGWRDFQEDRQDACPHKGFVDGDVVEALLELPRPAQQRVLERLRTSGSVVFGSLDGLLREVAELAQLH